MSFRVSEFKDSFYSLQGKLSQAFCLFSAHSTKQTRILLKIQIALAVLAIFLPCLVNSTRIWAGEVEQEDFKGFQVSMVSGVQDVSEVAAADFVTWENGVPLQVNDFRQKSDFELCSTSNGVRP